MTLIGNKAAFWEPPAEKTAVHPLRFNEKSCVIYILLPNIILQSMCWILHPAPRGNVDKGVECSESDSCRMMLFGFETSKHTNFFIEAN